MATVRVREGVKMGHVKSKNIEKDRITIERYIDSRRKTVVSTKWISISKQLTWYRVRPGIQTWSCNINYIPFLACPTAGRRSIEPGPSSLMGVS